MELRAKLALNHRPGQDFGLAFFDHDHGHAFLQILARGLRHGATTGRIKPDTHRWLAILRVKTRLRIGYFIAGNHNLFFDQHDFTAAANHFFRAKWGGLITVALKRIQVWACGLLLSNEAKFQRRRTTNNFFTLRRVQTTCDLNKNPALSLLLNNGFGNAQFIDPFTQRRDVLLQCAVLQFFECFRFHHRSENKIARIRCVPQLQFWRLRADFLDGFIKFGFLFKAHEDFLAFTGNAIVINLFIAQQDTNVAGITIDRLINGDLHIDFHQKVHAATQIKAERHGLCTQLAQPFG